MDPVRLTGIITAAKAESYVGNGAARTETGGRHLLDWRDGDFRYQDSYVGGTNFAGQEVLWHMDVPIWSMVYWGRVLRDDRIDGAKAAHVIRTALAAMYADGRFLGGWDQQVGPYRYSDGNAGDVSDFSGREEIFEGETLVYALDYHGGLIRA